MSIDHVPYLTEAPEQRVPLPVSEVMLDLLRRDPDESPATAHRPAPTGFDALDDVLAGGVRPGDLMLIGGMPGIGKTVASLQMARNVAVSGGTAIYACYEHDATTLLGRLLLLELGFQPLDPVRAERARQAIVAATDLTASLRPLMAECEPIREAYARVSRYAESLWLLPASPSTTGVAELADVVARVGQPHPVLFVDYLQKVAVSGPGSQRDQATRVGTQLKELALSERVSVVATTATSNEGFGTRRVRLHHLLDAAGLAYEADVVVVLDDKINAVSSVHLNYDPVRMETFRNYVVFTVEKNRRGQADVALEFRKDLAYYRFDPTGSWVNERLIDDRVTVR